MFKSFWAFALSLSLVTSLELNERAPAVTGCAYPSLASTISACKTGSAFCSGVLGRAPTTSTMSLKTYTTTVPASTLTYSIVKTIKTSYVTITSGTVTHSSTVISCIDSSPAANHRVAAVTAAPALGDAKTSCGVGGYSSAWVSTACECDYDATVYKAGTTVTVTSGTSVIQTTAKPTTTITSTVALTTISRTTTKIADNCYPPADSSCINPGGCDNGEFYTFICGSNDYYNCYCGSDITGRSTCFQAYNITCSDYYSDGDYEPCNANADCPSDKFCLENYCSCSGEAGFVGVCAKPDVCLGDVTSIKTQTVYDKAKKTAMPVL